MIQINSISDGTKGDQEFRNRMINWIKANYADILGADIRLLDQPGGLDLIQRKIQAMIAESRDKLRKAA